MSRVEQGHAVFEKEMNIQKQTAYKAYMAIIHVFCLNDHVVCVGEERAMITQRTYSLLNIKIEEITCVVFASIEL